MASLPYYTLLSMVQEFCKRRGLPTPRTVVFATDDTTLQIWGLLNEAVEDLTTRYETQVLFGVTHFTHAGGSGYNALDLREFRGGAIIQYIVNCTLWDTTNRRPVYGPLSQEEWQQLLVMNQAAAVYSFTMINNALCIYPAPTPLDSVLFGFIYGGRLGVQDTTQNEVYTYNFVKDTDTCKYPIALLMASLRWRYNKEKGLPYAEEFRTFEGMLATMASRDPAPIVSLNDDEPPFDRVAGPGLLVAAGNWPIH